MCIFCVLGCTNTSAVECLDISSSKWRRAKGYSLVLWQTGVRDIARMIAVRHRKGPPSQRSAIAKVRQLLANGCRPNARWLGGRELRQVAACQWCKTVQDRLALGIPSDRAWTRYVLRLVTSGVGSVHQWRGLVHGRRPQTTRAAALRTRWSGAMVNCDRPERIAVRHRKGPPSQRSAIAKVRQLLANGYWY